MMRSGTAPDPGDQPGSATSGLEEIIGALRRLAVAALDAGHPIAAAQIAGTADRVEVEAVRDLPQRPGYGSGAAR
jgi:hypothetical protein